MTRRYVVRKLDTESQWFYVVDTKVPRHALIAPESVVARYPSWRDAHQAADAFNEVIAVGAIVDELL